MQYLQRSEEGTRFLVAAVTGGYEPPDMGIGNKIGVLYKRISLSSELLL